MTIPEDPRVPGVATTEIPMRAPFMILAAVALVAIPVGLTRRQEESGVANGTVQSLPTVAAVGIMVNAPIGGGSEAFPDLAFMGTFERTRVALRLAMPEGGLIDLVRADSTLSVFRDDQGTDLTKSENPFGPFEMSPRVADDGHSMVFVAPSDQLPAAGAARLHLTGEAAVLVATVKEIARQEGVRFEDGTAVVLGPHTFEITSTGPAQWGDGWSFTLTSKADLASIVTYSAVGLDGQEIELRRSMSMSGGGTWSQSLDCDHPIEEATLVLEYWKAPEVVRVPFDLQVGLGLR